MDADAGTDKVGDAGDADDTVEAANVADDVADASPIWIVKPIDLSRGRGIRLTTEPLALLSARTAWHDWRGSTSDAARAWFVARMLGLRLDGVADGDHGGKQSDGDGRHGDESASSAATTTSPTRLVVQRYVERPYLLHGRKVC